jgi:pimeloyl-ACP methyl ester carboxylesterase
MIAPLAKFIDWLAIQIIWGRRINSLLKCKNSAHDSRLQEALEFLNGSNFIPVESAPARLEFNSESGRDFRFATPRPGRFAENNFAFGRLYRCNGQWRNHPTVILLHGAGGDPDYHFEFPRIARRCNRAGINAATLMLPLQFHRRPRHIERMIQWPDWLLMAEITFAQAIAEVRALTGWLLKEDSPAVALWGNSYGGQLAGIIAGCDVRLAAAVLTAPGVNLNVSLSVAKHMIWPRARAELLRQQPDRLVLNSTALNLTTIRPRIPEENILLIEAVHDLFVEKKSVEELWLAWKQPEIWRLAHSHATRDLAFGLNSRIIQWLEPRIKIEPYDRASGQIH